jgi:hypothetical protein
MHVTHNRLHANVFLMYMCRSLQYLRPHLKGGNISLARAFDYLTPVFSDPYNPWHFSGTGMYNLKNYTSDFPFCDTCFILIHISLQLEGFVVRSVYFRKKSVYCFFSLLCFNVFLAFLKIQGSTVASGIVSLLLNCLNCL